MSWTDEKVAELKKLWLEGKSASQIARLFGGGCTRNTVISKIHRLGKQDTKLQRKPASRPPIDRHGQLSGKAVDKIRAARKPPKPVPAAGMKFGAPTSATRVAPTFFAEPADEVGTVTVLEALGHHCRWPIGDPRADSFRLCGAYKPLGSSYCADHYARGVTGTVSSTELIRSVRRVA